MWITERMLKKHEFDIVIIGTPDHWHALQAIDSIKSGAHVFLQKPNQCGCRGRRGNTGCRQKI